MKKTRTYIAIDLKSFYASVECVERGLNPLTTNLVVADESRTSKTICLAVSPSLKSYGISGRARLFEVIQKVKMANADRKSKIYGDFDGESYDKTQLDKDPKKKKKRCFPLYLGRHLFLYTDRFFIFLRIFLLIQQFCLRMYRFVSAA